MREIVASRARERAEPPPGERLRQGWPYLVLAGLATAFVLLTLWLAGRAFLLLGAALLVATLLHAAGAGLRRLTGLGYRWCVALAFLAILAGFAAVGWFVAPGVAGHVQGFAGAARGAWEQVQNRIDDFALGRQALEQLHSGSGGVLGGIGQQVWNAASVTVSGLLDAFIVVMIGLYIALDPGPYLRGFLRLLPPARRGRAREIVLEIATTLRHWLLGALCQMLAIGVVCGVGDWLLGVPEALVLGIIAGLTEFIPNLGPVVGAVPAVLVAFGVGPWHALYVALFYAVVQGLEGNLLTPLVQQRAADVPPALTITAQLVMGLLGGILGVLLAVPLAASAIVAVRMAYVEDVLGDDGGKENAPGQDPGASR